MNYRTLTTLAVISAAFVSHANLLVNGSFEDGDFHADANNTMDLAPGATNMTGWTVSSANVAWITDPNPFSGIYATDGVRSLDLTSYEEDAGGVVQTLATNIGWTYTIEFDLGANSAYGDASISVNTGGADTDFTLHSDAGQVWEHHSVDFVATAASTDILLVHRNAQYKYTGLDNVSVSVESVPEPMTMAVLALAPLALRRRRK